MSAETKPKHKCRFKTSGFTGPFEKATKRSAVLFQCSIRDGGCGKEISRPMTAKEIVHYNRYHGTGDVHKVYHEFHRKFKLYPNDGGKKYKYAGYASMTKIEKWAKKYPNDVRIVGCDDSHFSGSDIIMIEHKTKDRYMGTTVIYVPQNSGDPAEFFLYPNHRTNLMQALHDIGKAARPVVKKQNWMSRQVKKMKYRP